jgi:hypothetical protein
MRIRLNFITPLLVAGAAAAAIAAAPTASSQPACVTASGSTQCHTPTLASPESDLYIGDTYGPFFTYNNHRG